MEVTVKVFRYNPEKDQRGNYVTYKIEAEPNDRILDVLGAQVQIGTTPANGWVNVETLPSGPYVMEVEHTGARISQRFVKQ